MFLSLLIYREPFYNIERHKRGERMPITTNMDKVQAVANAILHLPEDHKEVVFFKYEYGFSDKDTSSCLDMTIYDIEKKRKESRVMLEQELEFLYGSTTLTEELLQEAVHLATEIEGSQFPDYDDVCLKYPFSEEFEKRMQDLMDGLEKGTLQKKKYRLGWQYYVRCGWLGILVILLAGCIWYL